MNSRLLQVNRWWNWEASIIRTSSASIVRQACMHGPSSKTFPFLQEQLNVMLSRIKKAVHRRLKTERNKAYSYNIHGEVSFISDKNLSCN